MLQGRSHDARNRPDHRQGQHREGREQPLQPLTTEEADQILSRDGSVMVQKARSLAEALGSVKAAQIRNFYGSLLRIESKVESLSPAQIATELQLLRPKLAYMANRENKARPLRDYFDVLLNRAASKVQGSMTDDARRIATCVFEFAEAMVAYHREQRR